MRRISTAIAVAALMASGAAQAEGLKVGMITTLSGGGAGLGIDARDGFMLALKLGGPAAAGVEVVIEDRTACPRYCGLVIDGVVSGPSPNELRWQLQAVDQRAINLPVDLTNFVMLDLGQPMHAFDAAHVAGKSIHVRRATKGETTSGVNQKVVSIVSKKKIFGEGSSQQHVVASATMNVIEQNIVATEEEIVPGLAKHPVVSITSIHYIIASTSADIIRTVTTKNSVI